MTKDVLVSIRGAHMIEGESDDIEVITSGTYYLKNGKHYVMYEERIDGVDGAIKNTIKISENAIDIIKNGSTRSHMTFEEKKSNVSCYTTPFGQMMIGINTNEIAVEEKENSLDVLIDYTLDVNYSEMSHCRIQMKVQSKETADIHLKD